MQNPNTAQLRRYMTLENLGILRKAFFGAFPPKTNLPIGDRNIRRRKNPPYGKTLFYLVVEPSHFRKICSKSNWLDIFSPKFRCSFDLLVNCWTWKSITPSNLLTECCRGFLHGAAYAKTLRIPWRFRVRKVNQKSSPKWWWFNSDIHPMASNV